MKSPMACCARTEREEASNERIARTGVRGEFGVHPTVALSMETRVSRKDAKVAREERGMASDVEIGVLSAASTGINRDVKKNTARRLDVCIDRMRAGSVTNTDDCGAHERD